jgi:hypothetical protein
LGREYGKAHSPADIDFVVACAEDSTEKWFSSGAREIGFCERKINHLERWRASSFGGDDEATGISQLWVANM